MAICNYSVKQVTPEDMLMGFASRSTHPTHFWLSVGWVEREAKPIN